MVGRDVGVCGHQCDDQGAHSVGTGHSLDQRRHHAGFGAIADCADGIAEEALCRWQGVGLLVADMAGQVPAALVEFREGLLDEVSASAVSASTSLPFFAVRACRELSRA